MATTVMKWVHAYTNRQRQLAEETHIRLIKNREPHPSEARSYCARYCDEDIDSDYIRAHIEPTREGNSFAIFCDCEPDDPPKVVEIMLVFFLMLSVVAFVVKYFPWILGLEAST